MESFASDVQSILTELDESERHADELISVNFVVKMCFCQFAKKNVFASIRIVFIVLHLSDIV